MTQTSADGPPGESTTSVLPGSRRSRIVRRLLVVALSPLAILTLGPLALLTIVAETRAGRLVGWLALAALAVTGCLGSILWPASVKAGRDWIGLAVATFAAAYLVAILWGRPAPAPLHAPVIGLRSVATRSPRLMNPGPLGWLPEIDQIKLGATLITRLNPWIESEHARRIRRETLRLSREVEADPAGRALPVVSHLALAELLGRPFDAGHYYAYVPPGIGPGERVGAVVFLHGNAGNFKVLPWAWKPFADARRLVVICPTFGFGFWGEGGVGAVDRALDHALATLPIDPGRVILAGLSDGGNGVTRSARAHPERFRGLVYLSATLRADELDATFRAAWAGRPVLVIQGDRDINVLKRDVDPVVASLAASPVRVTYRVFAGEDHFLFFGRSGEVFETIGDWMDADGR